VLKVLLTWLADAPDAEPSHKAGPQ